MRNSDRRAADGLAVLHLAVLDLAGSVGDIGLTGLAETLETRARADAVNRDVARKAFVLEPLSHALSQRVHRG